MPNIISVKRYNSADVKSELLTGTESLVDAKKHAMGRRYHHSMPIQNK